MDMTTTATEDSMDHRETVVMEATEEVMVVVAVEAVAVARMILLNKETTTTMTKKTTTAGDLAALLIIATRTTRPTEVAIEEEIRTLAIGDLEVVNRVHTATDLETATSRKTLAFHEAELQPNTRQKVAAILTRRQVALSQLFLFQIFLRTTMKRS